MMGALGVHLHCSRGPAPSRSQLSRNVPELHSVSTSEPENTRTLSCGILAMASSASSALNVQASGLPLSATARFSLKTSLALTQPVDGSDLRRRPSMTSGIAPSHLGPASTAMLDSQASPYAARVFTARPTSPELCLPSPFFRALLLRRLRMPLPLAAAACRSARGFDVLGDHVPASPRSGVLRAHGGPLERAAARVCREAGATVQQHVLVSPSGMTSAGLRS